MSRLVFSRGSHKLVLYSCTGEQMDSWPAYSNTNPGTNEIPDGTYKFSWHSPHTGKTADSAFGSNGNFIFEVPGRIGIGIHSGREFSCVNPGPQHPTDGCIRTIDKATAKIREVHQRDPLALLTVKTNSSER
jgi:hypothetical protein